METVRVFLAAAAALIVASAGLYAQPAHAEETYVAKLTPLNSQVSGHEASGDLRLTVSNDTVTIEFDARGLPAGMMHMAHLHGYASGKSSTCPGADTDTNHDGIVDLAETEPAAGVTMIPLNAAPANLAIASDTYPVASKDGHVTYKQDASFSALSRGMGATFNGATPEFVKRVVFIHGIAPSIPLPDTVASLPGVPAQATLPIACGKLVRSN